MDGQILYRDYRDDPVVTDENGHWLKEVDGVPLLEWFPSIDIGSVLRYFFSLPLPSQYVDTVPCEAKPPRFDRMAKEFSRIVPQLDAPRMRPYCQGKSEHERFLLTQNLDFKEFREVVLFAQQVQLQHPVRCDMTKYVYDSVLHPIEMILTTAHGQFDFWSPEALHLNGFTLSPDIVGSFGHSRAVHVSMLIQPPQYEIGQGADLYYSGVTADEDFRVGNFLESFNEAVQCAVLGKCDALLICDGLSYLFYELKASLAGTGVIAVKRYAIVRGPDAVYTVRCCIYECMSNLTKNLEFPDFYFKQFRKTQQQLNLEREREWERELDWISTLEEGDPVDVDLGEALLDDINTGLGLNSQTIRVTTDHFPEQIRPASGTALCIIFDPYYYRNVSDQPVMAHSAYQWYKRESSVFAKFEALQGIAIPRLLGSGTIRDVWNGDDDRWLFCGPFLLLEDAGCDHPLPASITDYEAARNALSLLHNAGAQHGNVALETMVKSSSGRVMLINLEHASVYYHSSDDDDLDLQAIWPHFAAHGVFNVEVPTTKRTCAHNL